MPVEPDPDEAVLPVELVLELPEEVPRDPVDEDDAILEVVEPVADEAEPVLDAPVEAPESPPPLDEPVADVLVAEEVVP